MTLAPAQKPGASGSWGLEALGDSQQRSSTRSGYRALLESGPGIPHEPVCRGGRRGGYGARLGRRGSRAATTYGTSPGVLLPAARAQPLRSADADQCGPLAAGRGVVRVQVEGMWSGGSEGFVHLREEAPEGIWSERESVLRGSGLRGEVSEGITRLRQEAFERIMNLKKRYDTLRA